MLKRTLQLALATLVLLLPMYAIAQQDGAELGVSDLAQGRGTPGRAQLYFGDRLVATEDIPTTTPISLGLTSPMTIGEAPGAPVCPDIDRPPGGRHSSRPGPRWIETERSKSTATPSCCSTSRRSRVASM